MNHVVLPAEYSAPSVTKNQFRQARYYHQGRDGFYPVYLVIHCAECGETNGAAEGLMAYAATMPDGRKASWHYGIDCNSVTQSVLERDTAWHAPPLNACSIGVEMAGWSKQLDADWADPYSVSLLDSELVPLCAAICKRNNIPARLVPDDALRAALPQLTSLAKSEKVLAGTDMVPLDWPGAASAFGGILTHVQVSRVFKKSTHFDPGPFFPLDLFVSKVAAAIAASSPG